MADPNVPSILFSEEDFKRVRRGGVSTPAAGAVKQPARAPEQAALDLARAEAKASGSTLLEGTAAAQEELGGVRKPPPVIGYGEALHRAVAPQTVGTLIEKDTSAWESVKAVAGVAAQLPAWGVKTGLGTGAAVVKRFGVDRAIDKAMDGDMLGATGEVAWDVMTGEPAKLAMDIPSVAIAESPSLMVPSFLMRGISPDQVDPNSHLLEVEGPAKWAFRMMGAPGALASEVGGAVTDAAGVSGGRETRGRSRTVDPRSPLADDGGQFLIDALTGVEYGEGFVELAEAVNKYQGFEPTSAPARLIDMAGFVLDVAVPFERAFTAPGAVRRVAAETGELSRATGLGKGEVAAKVIAERLPSWVTSASVVDVAEAAEAKVERHLAGGGRVSELGHLGRLIEADNALAGLATGQADAIIDRGGPDAEAMRELVARTAREVATIEARRVMGSEMGLSLDTPIGPLWLTDKELERLPSTVRSKYAPSLPAARPWRSTLSSLSADTPEGAKLRGEAAEALGVEADVDVADPMSWQDQLLPLILQQETSRPQAQRQGSPVSPTVTAWGGALRDWAATTARTGDPLRANKAALGFAKVVDWLHQRPSLVPSERSTIDEIANRLERNPETVREDIKAAVTQGLTPDQIIVHVLGESAKLIPDQQRARWVRGVRNTDTKAAVERVAKGNDVESLTKAAAATRKRVELDALEVPAVDPDGKPATQSPVAAARAEGKARAKFGEQRKATAMSAAKARAEADVLSAELSAARKAHREITAARDRAEAAAASARKKLDALVAEAGPMVEAVARDIAAETEASAQPGVTASPTQAPTPGYFRIPEGVPGFVIKAIPEGAKVEGFAREVGESWWIETMDGWVYAQPGKTTVVPPDTEVLFVDDPAQFKKNRARRPMFEAAVPAVMAMVPLGSATLGVWSKRVGTEAKAKLVIEALGGLLQTTSQKRKSYGLRPGVTEAEVRNAFEEFVSSAASDKPVAGHTAVLIDKDGKVLAHGSEIKELFGPSEAVEPDAAPSIDSPRVDLAQEIRNSKLVERLRVALGASATDAEIRHAADLVARYRGLDRRVTPAPERTDLDEAAVAASGGFVGGRLHAVGEMKTPKEVVAKALDVITQKAARAYDLQAIATLQWAQDGIRRGLTDAHAVLTAADGGKGTPTNRVHSVEDFRSAVRQAAATGQPTTYTWVESTKGTPITHPPVQVNPGAAAVLVREAGLASAALKKGLGLDGRRDQPGKVPSNTVATKVVQDTIEAMAQALGDSARAMALAQYWVLDELVRLRRPRETDLMRELLSAGVQKVNVAPQAEVGGVEGLETLEHPWLMADLKREMLARPNMDAGTLERSRAKIKMLREEISSAQAEAMALSSRLEELDGDRVEREIEAHEARVKAELDTAKAVAEGEHKALLAEVQADIDKAKGDYEAAKAKANAREKALIERVQKLAPVDPKAAILELSQDMSAQGHVAAIAEFHEGAATLLADRESLEAAARSMQQVGLLDPFDVAKAQSADLVNMMTKAIRKEERRNIKFARGVVEAFTGISAKAITAAQAAAITDAWHSSFKDGGKALSEAIESAPGARSQFVRTASEAQFRMMVTLRSEQELVNGIKRLLPTRGPGSGLIATADDFVDTSTATDDQVEAAIAAAVQRIGRGGVEVEVIGNRILPVAPADATELAILRWVDRNALPNPRLSDGVVQVDFEARGMNGELATPLAEGVTLDPSMVEVPEVAFMARSLYEKLRNHQRRGLVPDWTPGEGKITSAARAAWAAFGRVLSFWKVKTYFGWMALRTPGVLLMQFAGGPGYLFLAGGLRGVASTASAVASNPKAYAAVWRKVQGFSDGGSAVLVDNLGRHHSSTALADAALRHGLADASIRTEMAGDLIEDINALMRDRFPDWREMHSDLGAASKAVRAAKDAVVKVATADGWVTELAFKALHAVDMTWRLATFFDEVQKGKAYDVAAEQARDVHLDYSKMSDFERFYVKKLIPFYAFWRKNMEAHFNSFLADPSRLGRLARLQRDQWEDDEWGRMSDRDIARRRVYLITSLLTEPLNDVRWSRTEPTLGGSEVAAFADFIGRVYGISGAVATEAGVGGPLDYPGQGSALDQTADLVSGMTIPPVGMLNDVRTGRRAYVTPRMIEIDQGLGPMFSSLAAMAGIEMSSTPLFDALDVRVVPTDDPEVPDGVRYEAQNTSLFRLAQGLGLLGGTQLVPGRAPEYTSGAANPQIPGTPLRVGTGFSDTLVPTQAQFEAQAERGFDRTVRDLESSTR